MNSFIHVCNRKAVSLSSVYNLVQTELVCHACMEDDVSVDILKDYWDQNN